MSPREEVARELADTCMFGGLNDSYGVVVEKTTDAKGKTFWSVTFAKARILDGIIRVYSPGFILVKWQGLGNGQEVVRSAQAAKKLLTDKFVSRFM